MKVMRALLIAAVAAATAAATGNHQQTICHDGTPEPTTPTPTTPTPTTPTPTTPEPTTPEPTTPEPVTPPPADDPHCAPVEQDIVVAGEMNAAARHNSTHSSCCVTCAALPGCSAYTFDNEANDCYLRFGKITRLGEAPGASSASVKNPRTCGLVEGIKYEGEEVSPLRLTPSADMCCWMCSTNNLENVGADCNAFAYEASSHSCHLLTKVTAKTAAEGWTSGGN